MTKPSSSKKKSTKTPKKPTTASKKSTAKSVEDGPYLSRKRKLSGAPTNYGFDIRYAYFLRAQEPFDKKLLMTTLERTAKCNNPLCDPLFRRFRQRMTRCDNCVPYFIELYNRLIFTEDLHGLREHARRAFEHVAQIASNLEDRSSDKDKRLISFVHMKQLSNLVSSMIQQVCRLSDQDLQVLKKCSQITFIIVDPSRTFVKEFGSCQMRSCYNSCQGLCTVKADSYDPQTFKPIKSSGEKINYRLCKLHAYAFSSIHKLQHTYYNAYQNFRYWMEQSKGQELHESFDSKLKVDSKMKTDFAFDFSRDDQTQAQENGPGFVDDPTQSKPGFLDIEQELLKNLTEEFVRLLMELDGDSQLTQNTIYKPLWISRLVLVKSQRLWELAQRAAPLLVKKIDENRATHNFSKKPKIAHLIYKDPD